MPVLSRSYARWLRLLSVDDVTDDVTDDVISDISTISDISAISTVSDDDVTDDVTADVTHSELLTSRKITYPDHGPRSRKQIE